MSKISLSGYLVYAGWCALIKKPCFLKKIILKVFFSFAATLSSAIASLVGAPRVLQVKYEKK